MITKLTGSSNFRSVTGNVTFRSQHRSLGTPEFQFQAWNRKNHLYDSRFIFWVCRFIIRAIAMTAVLEGRQMNCYGSGGDGTTLCRQGRSDDVLSCMDSNTYVRLLEICINTKSLAEGKRIHARITNTGFKPGIFLQNRLVELYAKCGQAADARQVFDEMPKRNVFSWNTMIAGYFKCGFIQQARQTFDRMPERDDVSWATVISGYAQDGNGQESLRLFGRMHREGFKPNQFTFASVLCACTSLLAVHHGKQVHAYIFRTGFMSNVLVGNALVDMYAKCQCIDHARQLFDKMPERDVISWSAMIKGFVHNERGETAFHLFCLMLRVGVKPNDFTYASALSACASPPGIEQGKMVHAHMIKSGYEATLLVGNALVDMYVKCGSTENGRRVFDKMPEIDTVSWTSLIAGYSQAGNDQQAVKLFCQMRQAGIGLDHVTFSCVLSACAGLAVPGQGKQVHADIIKSALVSNVFVGSALIDMYGKCGNIEEAHKIFDRMPERNVVSWNAMIAGYAQNGCGKKALKLFEQMLQIGLKPNYVSFLGVMSACCHAGLVEEGHRYFNSMSQDHSITPRADHYACMIDLLGRAGHLEEAGQFIRNMPFEPDAIIWGALLGACRIHRNMELGKQAAERLFELEPESSGPYVLLSNICAAFGRWDDAAEVRKLMRDRGVRKTPGCSWIEVNNKLHTFIAEDRSHPQTGEIYTMLDRVAEQMEAAGYAPDKHFVLHDMEEEY